MIEQRLEDLAHDLKQRRQLGELPPVLLLGAGASVEAGVGAMQDLLAFAQVPDFDAFVQYIQPRTEAGRYRLLSNFLQTRRPQEVTEGYRSLAALCEEGYFDLILTTNLDPLLDDALAAARLWRKDYLLLVNGVVRQDRLELLLSAPMPRLKVLKLHGDLFHRFMAWTPAEMERYIQDIRASLDEVLQRRDLLIVGHGLRDARILELVEGVARGIGVVWYTHPAQAPDSLSTFDRVRAVVDSRCKFEKLFTNLLIHVEPERLHVEVVSPAPPSPAREPTVPNTADLDVKIQGTRTRKSGPKSRVTDTAAFDVGIGRRQPKRGTDPVPPWIQTTDVITSGTSQDRDGLSVTDDRAQTLDDLKTAVVGVGEFHGRAPATGFVIREPRGILCDRYPVDAMGKASKVAIRTSTGERLVTSIQVRSTRSPFGPVLLELPESLNVAALDVDPVVPLKGERVRVAVAAGDRPGISSGTIAAARPGTITVESVGKVSGVYRLDLAVAPGSSGAPVVDAAMRVRGFIVAGKADEPESWMDPASRWLELIRKGRKPSRR